MSKKTKRNPKGAGAPRRFKKKATLSINVEKEIKDWLIELGNGSATEGFNIIAKFAKNNLHQENF